MGKKVRVGPTVFEDGEKVAEYTHGAWYQYKERRKGLELVPCDPLVAAEYDALVDATTAPLDDGELAVLGVAKELCASAYPHQRVRQAQIVESVTERVKYGITKHGPYDPASDDRDLHASAARAARNVLVFCCMELARPNPQRPEKIRSVAVAAMDLVLRLEQ